jgi:hypothetical protein
LLITYLVQSGFAGSRLPARRNQRNIVVKEEMNNDETEASPVKAVIEELQELRAEVRQSADSYTARLDSEIERVRAAVEAGSNPRSLSSSRLRDLRDMLTLLRRREIKADKGRRKDLKRLESVVSDLGMLIENW